MSCSLELHQFTTVFLFRITLGEFGDEFDRDETVIPSVVEHAGSKATFRNGLRRTVFSGLIPGGEILRTNSLAGGVDQGAEKEKSGWPELIAGFLSDFRESPAAECEVSSGSCASKHDVIGINAEDRSVLAEKDHGHGGILKGVYRVAVALA